MTTRTAPAERLDPKLLAVAGVVVLGAVMSILDTTVVNVAINTLSRDFHTSLSTIQWVVTGYTLALATVIPLTGWGATASAPSGSTCCRSACSSPARRCRAPRGRPAR